MCTIVLTCSMWSKPLWFSACPERSSYGLSDSCLLGMNLFIRFSSSPTCVGILPVSSLSELLWTKATERLHLSWKVANVFFGVGPEFKESAALWCQKDISFCWIICLASQTMSLLWNSNFNLRSLLWMSRGLMLLNHQRKETSTSFGIRMKCALSIICNCCRFISR